jgi:predicted transposase YbfD/YdcC
MKTVQQEISRVESFTEPRLRRAVELLQLLAADPRDAQGLRHPFTHCILSLLAALLCGRGPLRAVEALSKELALGRRGKGISDGALTHLLELMGEHDLDAVLVQSVRDMGRRGQLKPVELNQSWMTIDGKYSTLDHDCGGLAQKIEDKHGVHWRLGFLRAVLITAAGKPALGQWPMAPVEGELEKDAEKRKHTGETTNLPLFIKSLRKDFGDLASNFTLDAGLWSKAIFLAMDGDGLGVFAGLKGNKPELFGEAKRVLRRVRTKQKPAAETAWQPCPKGKIRRRLWRTTELDGWNGWTHLRQVVVVEQTTRDRDDKDTVELRYFVTNATTGMLTAWQLLRLVRLHWGIENDCNWTFDVQFGEDAGAWCTLNKATLVLGVLRMIAYNILQWLRKVHVQVERERVANTPRPWRSVFELVHRYLVGTGNGLLQSLARPAPGLQRQVPLLLPAGVT